MGCNCGSSRKQSAPVDTVSYEAVGVDDPIALVQFRKYIQVTRGATYDVYITSEVKFLTYSNIRSILLGFPDALYLHVPSEKADFLSRYPEFGVSPYAI